MKIETTCKMCGKNIVKYTRKNKEVKHYFCSPKCQYEYKHQHNSKEVECVLCGNKIVRRNSHIKDKTNLFCSNDCKTIWRNKNSTKKEVVCCNCNTRFVKFKSRIGENGFNFCSRKCYNEWKLKNKFTNCINYRFQAFQFYERKCEVCGFNKIEGVLDVHHIDGNHKNNDKSNLIILCPTCHVIVTRKYGNIINRKLEIF